MRLARVFPNHVAALLAMVALFVTASAMGVTLGGLYPLEQLPLHLAMTHAWFRSPGQEWNYPSWSVSAEWFAYLVLFPIGAWWLRRRWPVAVNLGLALYLTQTWLYIANGTWPRELFPILRIVCGFMAGVCLYGVWRTAPRVTAWCRRHATALLTVFIIAIMVLPAFLARAPDLMMIVMPLLLLGLTDDASRAARLLGSRPMLWLGRLSYALYMSHAITERLLEWTLPVAAFTQAGLAVRLGVLLVYWAMLFAGRGSCIETVEEPGRAWLRSFGRSR
jgi:peptidoglycan/LPS O-acetylase OafA/YrhL